MPLPERSGYMKRKSLNDIMNSIKTGRAISPAGVRNAAVALMETMVPAMVEADYDGREFWTITLLGFVKPVRMARTYWDAVGGMESQAVFHYEMPGELFMSLASLHKWGSESVKRWMSFSVEDVMHEAGMDVQYEQWFQREAKMWEKEYGKVPSVNDIMKIGFDLEWFEQFKVKPYIERADFFYSEKISNPFHRDWAELGVKPLCLKTSLEGAKYKYTRLVCTWIWLLMVEAPGRIYSNCHLEQAHD